MSEPEHLQEFIVDSPSGVASVLRFLERTSDDDWKPAFEQEQLPNGSIERCVAHDARESTQTLLYASSQILKTVRSFHASRLLIERL